MEAHGESRQRLRLCAPSFLWNVDGNGRKGATLGKRSHLFGWGGGPQSVAAIRSIAQHMELRKRKGATLGKGINLFGWEGGPQDVAAIRDRRANVHEYRKTWKNSRCP